MKKKSAPKDAKSKQINDNSINAQQSRILAALEIAKGSGVSTIECRAQHNVLHPAGRIKELREMGYVIETVWITTEDDYGRKHRVAKYVLISRTTGRAA